MAEAGFFEVQYSNADHFPIHIIHGTWLQNPYFRHASHTLLEQQSSAKTFSYILIQQREYIRIHTTYKKEQKILLALGCTVV